MNFRPLDSLTFNNKAIHISIFKVKMTAIDFESKAKIFLFMRVCALNSLLVKGAALLLTLTLRLEISIQEKEQKKKTLKKATSLTISSFCCTKSISSAILNL